MYFDPTHNLGCTGMNTDSTSAIEGFRRVGSYAVFAFVYILPQKNSACHEMFMEIRKKYLNHGTRGMCAFD
jgi:hypothetical protein